MSEIDLIFEFLKDPRAEVRQLAVDNVLSFTKNQDFVHHFKKNDCAIIKTLALMRKENAKTAHDAISCLINLSSDLQVLSALDSEAFVKDVILSIILPKSLLADLFCMLLNNMTKYLPIVQKILTDSKATPYLDNLLEVFTRGYQHNNSAQFHFLACVFANLSATLEGAMFFMAHSTVDNTPRLNRLLSCTENKDVIRRGGVISTLKNCCFCIELHSVVLENDQFLTSILLPLCGNETFDEEDSEKMLDGLQLLEHNKCRESDARLRILLLESLILLCTSRQGRDKFRDIKVYALLQKMHLAEKDETVINEIEKVVDLLIRDEEPFVGKIEEIVEK